MTQARRSSFQRRLFSLTALVFIEDIESLDPHFSGWKASEIFQDGRLLLRWSRKGMR